MSFKSRSGKFGYGVIVVGIMLAAVSAIVPFYTSGYRLWFGVFMAGIMPYLAYGLVVALFRHSLTNLAGAILLALHGWLVISERFSGHVDYSDGVIYFAPLVFTALLTPLVVRALREPWHG